MTMITSLSDRGPAAGPVAANLARAGFKVLVLEAGGIEEPFEYQVPAFHALSTEHNELEWKFYVQHYEDRAGQGGANHSCVFLSQGTCDHCRIGIGMRWRHRW